MTTFTIDQLTAKVRELAAERPDFVYEAPDTSDVCLYVHGYGQPGCIFGHAFAALGVEADTLAELDGVGGIGTVLQDLGIQHTDDQRDWCIEVQTAQDVAERWADAVASADAEVSA